MKSKIVYIERKCSESVSLEKVFRQIAKSISKTKFEIAFEQLPYFNRLSGILKNFIYFQKPTADIYHITGDIHYIALLLPSEKTVLTIHDLRFLHIKKGLRRFVLKKLFLDLPVKRLNYITAISEGTKNEIIKYTNCASEKIRLIKNPLREHFSAAANKEFNSKCPTILQIGTAPNKNVINLVRALNGIKCRLRIIGRIGTELMNELKRHGINFEHNFNLSDAEIREEYVKADIVSFCSTFEGFGLPVIEAQAMRTAVITSNISPLREVSGGGATLVDPSSVSEIREGILRLIKDKTYRENLLEKGIENTKKFEPKVIASLYENLYQEIIEAGKK
jgi:glycosyltransferase involved in cell wall biosynthesis